MTRDWWREKGLPLLSLVPMVLILAWALGGSIAHADPDMSMGELYADARAADICEALDDAPTFIGVIAVLTAINEAGLSPAESAVAVRESVRYVCPHHIPLLKAFATYYQNQPKKGVAV